jgi:hypothetical protein
MKYSEFEFFMNHVGLKINNFGSDKGFFVTNRHNDAVAWISKIEMHKISTNWTEFGHLTKEEQEFVIKKCYELACTPLDEREEEKQYRLKFENNLKEIYVLFDESKSEWDYYDNGKFIGNKNRKSIFTESELEHIDETGFVREEVTE